MRYFQCFDCQHIWKITFWEDGKDTKMACPDCKSLDVHQIEKVRGWDREGKYTILVEGNDQALNHPCYENVRRESPNKES